MTAPAARAPIATLTGEVVRSCTYRVWAYRAADPGYVAGPPEECREAWPAEIEADAILGDGTVVALTDEELADVLEQYEEEAAR